MGGVGGDSLKDAPAGISSIDLTISQRMQSVINIFNFELDFFNISTHIVISA